MATLVSKAAYAKLHGKSAQAAQKWETKGALVFRDGKVHVELSDQRMAGAGLGRFAVVDQPASTINRAGLNHQPPPVDAPAAPQVERDDDGAVDYGEPETARSLDAFVEALLAGSYSDQVTADAVKANALALKHVLAARREAGQLVEVEVAEAVIFEEFRAARDAWLNFPARVGAALAAQLGVDADRVIEGLSAHVQQQLEDLGEPEPDFAPPAQA